MRRAWVLAISMALLTAACAEQSGDAESTPTPTETPSPTVSPMPTATSDDLEDASCDDRQGGDPNNFPDFVEVSIESEGDTEKVEFRFEPEGDPSDAPQYFVGFTDQLITDGEGAPVDVAGEAFVSISFMAQGVDLSGEEFEPIYTGPTEFTPDLSTVLEVEQTGDFEGLVSWGIGLSSRACFVVDARPDRIILEFPAS
ncbi:MAG TPA: hypothetical protein VF097_06945 [Actinomycetota bacterium]